MKTQLNFQPGCECLIRSLGSNKKMAQRLADMGVLPGSKMRIIRLAPFGETLEVSIDDGQYLALREDEINALDCDMMAMPLASPSVKLNQTYRIRSLADGKIFRQRMERYGIAPGITVRIHELSMHALSIELLPLRHTVKLGFGEAQKIIVEVTHGRKA